MSYGAGYRYRGDPFLGGLLKGGLKVLGGAVKGAVGAIGSQLGISRPSVQPPSIPTASFPGVGTGVQFPTATRPGQTAGYQMQPGLQTPPPGPGYRPNKSSYFLRNGTFVPAGSKWVRYRRRNPANARALRKALSRAEAFGGIVKRVRKTTRRLKTI